MILHIFSDDEPRRPGQRLPTSMLGNEVTISIMTIIIISIHIHIVIISLNYAQVMSKEQLYDLFQQILNVKKFEHQLLYNAMQVLPYHHLHHIIFEIIIVVVRNINIIKFIPFSFLKDTIVTHHRQWAHQGELISNMSELITVPNNSLSQY